MNRSYPIYLFLLLFKIFRPIRKKYNLSVNPLLVLSACYVYSINKNKDFSREGIANYLTYYNTYKVKAYFSVLRNKGYITIVRTERYDVYNITRKGINIIEELKRSYFTILREYSEVNNIDFDL